MSYDSALRALPTTYNGVEFRSRLEADWAATLNHWGIPWQYEPEGYELSDGSYYLPDFYLPSADAWLEVKGDHDHRLDKLHLFAADLWDRVPWYTVATDRAAPLVLLARPFDSHTFPGHIYADSPMGIRGPGKGYSVAPSTCPSCRQGTFVALWAAQCRGCGHLLDDPVDWISYRDPRTLQAVRVPRPTPKRATPPRSRFGVGAVFIPPVRPPS